LFIGFIVRQEPLAAAEVRRAGRKDRLTSGRQAISARPPAASHSGDAAVVMREFGPPSVLVADEVSEPVAGPGQVAIDVEVANITFVETQVRAGRPPHPAMLPALPAILGNGVGGLVAAVGDGVDASSVGRRVVTSLRGTGGYAECAVADSSSLIQIPDELSMHDAVALLADGRTAMLQMHAAAIRSGETVLVEAAAGGVGSLLVQLARNAGARVVGAAGGQRKLELARQLGANVVVDYTLADWPAQLRADLGAVDVVFDGVGGAIGRAAFELLRPGGRFCAFGMSSGAFAQITDEEAASRHIALLRGGRATPEELRELAQAALAEARAGRLRPVIGQTFPLEHAADAHAAMERRETIGKTLLLVRG
jgi:NADPH2:quinone reductase